MEMSGALTKVLPWQCGGNTRGLLYIDEKGSEMKNSRLRGKTAVVLPTSSPRRVGLLAGICWTKSQVPAIPRGWGGAWLQMTSALADNMVMILRCTICMHMFMDMFTFRPEYGQDHIICNLSFHD